MPKRVVDKTITIEDLEKQELEQSKKAEKGSKSSKKKIEKQPKNDESTEILAELKTDAKDSDKKEIDSDKKKTTTTSSENTDSDKKEKSKETTPDKESKATDTQTKKTKKPKQKKVRSKRYLDTKKQIETGKTYQVEEAIKTLRKMANAKFNESVELHITLGTETQNSDHRIRFTTTLPHGIGKTIKVLVISDDNSGQKDNIIYRDASAIDEIVAGKLQPEKDFNVVVATPATMKDIAKVARILGPKGMMPSPKNNTVTDNPQKAIESLGKGQIEIKSQPNHAVIHQIVGNLSFKDEQLVQNTTTLIEELNKNTPPKMKKKLIQKIYLCSTMGPSVRVEG